jgi:hypothetical protein
MLTDQRTAARAPVTYRSRAARWLVGVGVTLLLLGVVLLVVPNATHQDMPNVGEDVFFDCGGALYPGAKPAEEPGITACRDINDSMMRWGFAFIAGGASAALGGLLLRRRARLASS